MTRTIDRHTISVQLPDDSTVNLGRGYVTIDEQWSPYAQGVIEIAPPDDLADFDPRAGAPRVIVDMHRVLADADTVADLSTAYGAGTVAGLTTLYGAGTVADLTSIHTRQWVPGESRRPQSRTVNLGIRTRTINTDGTLSIRLASDEALLQDYAPWGNDDDHEITTLYADPENTTGSFASLVVWVVQRVIPGATFAPILIDWDFSALIITNPAGTGIPWLAGTSAWDFLTPLLQVAGYRLWCDEARLWHLDLAPVNVPGALEVDALVEIADTLSRDPGSDWYNAVVILYKWVDPDTSQSLIASDTAPYDWPDYPRVLTITHDDVVYPGPGAAAKMLTRILARGRALPNRSVSDYRATPGMAVTITPPNSDPYEGAIASVTWDYETAEMNLTVRDTEGI